MTCLGPCSRAARAALCRRGWPPDEEILPPGCSFGRSGGTLTLMVTTVVLTTCDIHRVPETAQAIADLPEVSEVYSVAGDYDLVVMVRVKNHDDLARVVSEGIAKVEGVERTQTLVAFKVYSRHDVESLFSLGFEEERA